ncbi:MAG: PilZ domain-containing protein [Candidatus Eremiobacteraeota bacterium]|nr:PilZ domain-containing protein [Candidatus Eremiobacteraeota bacterium]
MWPFVKKKEQSAQEKQENPEDRRRLARIDMILTVNCHLPGEQELFRISTENVNVLGIKFVSPVELKELQDLDMKILLQSNFPTINVKGRVVWVIKKATDKKTIYIGGIEFFPYDEEEKKFFQKFIDKHVTGEFEIPPQKRP